MRDRLTTQIELMWGVFLGEVKGVVRENGSTERPCEEKGAGGRERERASKTERCREGEEVSENECTKFPNLWDTIRAGSRGKFIALHANIK